MFLGVPIWAWQLAIALLRVCGAVNWASALSAKLGLEILAKLKKVKTYHDNNDFPHPFPGLTNASSINRKTS